MNVNFEVAVGGGRRVAETWNDGGDGSAWKLHDSRSSDEAARQQSGFRAVQWRLLDAPDGREERHEYCASFDLRDAVSTSEDLSELPSVEETIDVAREDAEANVPTAVTTPKEPGAVERSRHELTPMPYRSWCFSCAAGRGADDPHRKSDGYSGPPRVECDFMFLSSRVHLTSPGLTIFDTMDRESQSMAAALSVQAASDLLVRLFLAMLDAWRRSHVKVLLRSDQEVTLTVILRDVQARRQQRTLVERSPVESHATLGAMERASLSLPEMLRTMKHATEMRVGGRLETDHPSSAG